MNHNDRNSCCGVHTKCSGQIVSTGHQRDEQNYILMQRLALFTEHTFILGFHSNQQHHLAKDRATEIASHILPIWPLDLVFLLCSPFHALSDQTSL